jgi:hypothetical protein
MSNEEHIEEMYYLSHISGVFKEFSNEVTKIKNNNPKRNFSEIVQDVFEEFVSEGFIQSDIYLFI